MSTNDTPNSESLVTQTSPKPRRQYIKSGFFRKWLDEDELEAMDAIYAGLLEENPDLAQNTAWCHQAQILARDMVLEMRCAPPRSPGDDHGMKVSVSRSKIVMARLHQLALTRQQAKERDTKDDPIKWAAAHGFGTRPQRASKPPNAATE